MRTIPKLGLVAASVACSVAALAMRAAAAAPAPAYCRNAYADDLSALSAAARDTEAHARSYSYAVRTSATYECVSYGADGNLETSREVAMAHGTAFAYRRDGADTLLLTNDHVAEWPAVTSTEHPVDGVPGGCKRVADSLAIVDNDRDSYTADDIPLSRVAVDPELDVAILRAHAELQILPWRVGTSAALAARTVVEVKGFPLGAFQATNVGKVVSVHDHDEQGDWDHDDFVVDALLSAGGSGSPVLAVSCKTGELELVGIFHAQYREANALNVVVAIDQVRGLMTTLQPAPRRRPAPEVALDAAARARLVAATRGDKLPVFAFGALVASVEARDDGALIFSVFGNEFPTTTQPLLVVEDLVDAAGFGKPGAVYVGGAQGISPYAVANADADSQTLVARTLDLLRQDALAVFEYRAAAATATASRAAFESIQQKKRALARMLESQRETSQRLVDLPTRISPPPGASPTHVAKREVGPAE